MFVKLREWNLTSLVIYNFILFIWLYYCIYYVPFWFSNKNYFTPPQYMLEFPLIKEVNCELAVCYVVLLEYFFVSIRFTINGFLFFVYILLQIIHLWNFAILVVGSSYGRLLFRGFFCLIGACDNCFFMCIFGDFRFIFLAFFIYKIHINLIRMVIIPILIRFPAIQYRLWYKYIKEWYLYYIYDQVYVLENALYEYYSVLLLGK